MSWVPPGRLLRTVRHLRPRQALAQLAHALRPEVTPSDPRGGTPRLCAERAIAPFLPAPPHARCQGALRIELLNRAAAFPGKVDWDHAGEGPLWAYHLHEFHWARCAGLAPAERAAVMLDWIERHPAGIGWDPHPLSLRILSWSKLLLSPDALELGGAARRRVHASLARQIETLSRNLEVRLQANHLLSNLLGVVFGGIYFEGAAADRWLDREALLGDQLEQQILADGAHVERSPMYHSLLLENLLDLLNLARGVPSRAPLGLAARLEACAARMLGALGIWTHPDGQIALFADAAHGIAHPPRLIEEYAARLGVRPQAPQPGGALAAAGFVRLAAPPFCLIASVGGPLPAHQPGHAHCDALAFELSIGDQRVVTDTGVFEYTPGARRDLSRATRAHATLEIAGGEQAEVWQAHRIGGRPEVALESLDPGRSAVARCASWNSRDSVHRRRFRLSDAGLGIVDEIEGASRPVRMALPLAPGLEPVLEDGVARIPLAQGRRLTIQLPDPKRVTWRVERLAYFPEFGCERDRACLVGEAPAFREGIWRFSV